MGSSPLMRGKHGGDTLPDRVPGLIPAHAGKTTPPPNAPGFPWAHPHSRGENNIRADLRVGPEGSSPLTRGKRSAAPARRRTVRLIPAHAGKTRGSSPIPSPTAAHPRSCGENDLLSTSEAARMGSSPLTRGKQAASRGYCVAARLIPTHAGKTPPRSGASQSAPAHPRSRGENCAHPVGQRYVLGSSPLTRGKRRSAPAH